MLDGGGEIQMELVVKSENDDEEQLPSSSARNETLSPEHIVASPSRSTEMTKDIIEKEEDVKLTSIVKNQSHSLKRSILNKFIPLTFSLLLVVSLCTIAALYISNRYIINETHQMLEDQYSRYGTYIAQGESAAITAVLAWTGLEVEAGMTCDFFRNNYSIADPNSTYLGYTPMLALPVSDSEARFPGKNVSLAHSSYAFPNMSYNELVHGLSSAQQRSRDRISKIDPIAKAIYNIKQDTLQSFIAMEEDGLFVVYPGQGMENNNSFADPRSRPWYMLGKEQQDVTVITEPYIDLFTNELVISLARAVHNVETGDFVGVFALDFLVNSLQQYVQPSYNLEREMVLFVSSGRVLLDSEWFSNSSSAEIDYTSTYSTIVNPTFSDKEWSVIQGIDPGKNTDLEVDGEYHCYVFRFLEPMEGLVFVACADLDVQLEEATDLELLIEDHWVRGLILVISISCVLIALTLSVFYYTVSTLARGVDRSYKKINNLFHSLRMQAEEHQSNTKNEPGDRLAKTFDAHALAGGGGSAGGTRELREGGRGHQSRGRPVRAMSRLFSPSDALDTNPFWNKTHPFLHHHEVSERYLTRPPNTPPPSGRHLEAAADSQSSMYSFGSAGGRLTGGGSPLASWRTGGSRGSHDDDDDDDEDDDDYEDDDEDEDEYNWNHEQQAQAQVGGSSDSDRGIERTSSVSSSCLSVDDTDRYQLKAAE